MPDATMTLDQAFEIADQAAPLPHLAAQALRCMRAEIDRLRGDNVDIGGTVLVGHIHTDGTDPVQASHNFTDVMYAIVAEILNSLASPDDREIFLAGLVSTSAGACAARCGMERTIAILDQVKQIILADPRGGLPN